MVQPKPSTGGELPLGCCGDTSTILTTIEQGVKHLMAGHHGLQQLYLSLEKQAPEAADKAVFKAAADMHERIRKELETVPVPVVIEQGRGRGNKGKNRR